MLNVLERYDDNRNCKSTCPEATAVTGHLCGDCRARPDRKGGRRDSQLCGVVRPPGSSTPLAGVAVARPESRLRGATSSGCPGLQGKTLKRIAPDARRPIERIWRRMRRCRHTPSNARRLLSAAPSNWGSTDGTGLKSASTRIWSRNGPWQIDRGFGNSTATPYSWCLAVNSGASAVHTTAEGGLGQWETNLANTRTAHGRYGNGV